jgi:hypothetical protein
MGEFLFNKFYYLHRNYSLEENHMIKKLGIILGRILAFLLTMALCLPVVLLPKGSSVPANIWIPLAAADLGLVVIFFQIKPIARGTAISLAGVCAVALIAVLCTQVYSKTVVVVNPESSIIHSGVSYLQQVVMNTKPQ